jgi:hypothetical protein
LEPTTKIREKRMIPDKTIRKRSIRRRIEEKEMMEEKEERKMQFTLRRIFVIMTIVAISLSLFRKAWLAIFTEWRQLFGPTTLILNWFLDTPMITFVNSTGNGEFNWVNTCLVIGWGIAVVLCIVAFGFCVTGIVHALKWSRMPKR